MFPTLHREYSGERGLLACSCRQLADNILGKSETAMARGISAGCRDEQAGSLCSPVKGAAAKLSAPIRAYRLRRQLPQQ
jgi:hypothetical protein